MHRRACYLIACLAGAGALLVRLHKHISSVVGVRFFILSDGTRSPKNVSVLARASPGRNRIESPTSSPTSSVAAATIKVAQPNLFNATTKADLEGCLSESCIRELAGRLARAFPRKNRTWCVEYPVGTNRSWQGIILVKLPKGASSTSAGVALRLGDRHNCSAVQFNHRMASDYRDHTDDALLFTTIRDPSSRAVSRIFFSHISRFQRLQKDPETFLMEKLPTLVNPQFGTVSAGQGGFQLRYTSLEPIPADTAWDESNPEQVLDPERVVQRVMQTFYNYTMMLVTERMDESLVALALVLGIDVGDVLVQGSKVSGASNYYYLPPKQTCFAITKTSVTAKVQNFLDSNQWRAMNYGDFLLHAVANRSLDLTIDSLQPEFDSAMDRYQRLTKLVRETCRNETAFPCSADGKPQLDLAIESCYKKDFGCGHRCVDQVIAKYDATR